MARANGFGRTRVLVVDDNPAIGDTLRLAIGLERDLECVGVAATIGEAIRLTEQEEPDVVLMDQHLPGEDGVAGTRRLKELRPRTQVLLASADFAPELMAAAAAAGVSGFAPKGTSLAEVVDGIRAAAVGEVVVRPAALTSLLGRIAREAAPAPPDPDLSDRERALLDAMAEGLDTAGIASRVGLGVEECVAEIGGAMEKLGARSRLQGLAEAARRGAIAGFAM